MSTEILKSRDRIESDIFPFCFSILKEAGFSRSTKHVAYRSHKNRVDIVELRMARRGYNSSFNTGKNSFEIEAAVFFKFAPHPMMAAFNGIDNFPIKKALDGHFRTKSKPGIMLRDGLNSFHWRTKPWGFLRNVVLSDVEKNLRNYMLPWFEKFSNLEAIDQYLSSEPSPDEINNEGNRRCAEAWGTLFASETLAAFLSLQLGNWDQAKIKLTGLLNKPHPGHKNDPVKYPQYLYQKIRADIENGLVLVETKQ